MLIWFGLPLILWLVYGQSALPFIGAWFCIFAALLTWASVSRPENHARRRLARMVMREQHEYVEQSLAGRALNETGRAPERSQNRNMFEPEDEWFSPEVVYNRSSATEVDDGPIVQFCGQCGARFDHEEELFCGGCGCPRYLEY